ncbi:MAG: hypothetical protein RIT10_627, partial [Bacteroidota bacterium]
MMVTFFSKQQAVKGNPAFLANGLFVDFKTTHFNLQKFFLQTSLLLLALCFSWNATAQITNIKFDTEDITYAEISGGTNIVNGGSTLGAVSALTPIGFNFIFQGNTYANISVNAAGLLKFGAVVVTTESVNNASSILNTPKLYAWWDATYTVSAANGGGVSTLLTGSAPNRVLTIQWKVAYAANATTGFSYQIKLYETSNKIEYLYGAVPGSPQSASVGLGNYGADEYLSIYTFNHIPSGRINYNTNTFFPGAGAGIKYIFSPTATSTVSPDCFSSKPSWWVKADSPSKSTRTLKNVPAGNRVASSELNTTWTAAASILTGSNGWIPNSAQGATAVPTGSNPIGNITLDLGSVQAVDGVVTLGAGSAAYYALDYYVKVSNDLVTWTNIGLLEGNENNTGFHYADFPTSINCRYVRVIPSSFAGYRAMRLDVYTKSTSIEYANNDKVPFMEDLSGNELDAYNNFVANQPTYNTNQINFNPALNFANAGSLSLNMPDLTNIRQAYWISQDLTPIGGNYNHILYGNGTAPYYHGGATGQLGFGSTMSATNVAFQLDGASATAASSYDFGPQGNPNLVGTTALVNANPISATTISFQAGQVRSWQGPIAEIITFQNPHNAAQKTLVNSYFGIKYGLTLDQDYLSGTGTTVWNKTTNVAYHNNVFGIGRSDCQGLHQRQSFSTNYTGKFVTLGNNSVIGTTNAASVGNDLTSDNSYIIIGDNNGDLLYSETLVGNYYPLGRKWKVSNASVTEATKISIPAFGNSSNFTLPNSAIQTYEAETVYLVLDADGDGNFVNATYSAMTKVGSGANATWEISQVLLNNAVIGFAVKQNLLDTDTDGVLDVSDLDDDNDGILDRQEQISCITFGKNIATVNFNGSSVVNSTINSITTNTPAWTSSYSTENFSLPLSLKFNRTTTEGAVMFGLIPSANTQTPNNYNDLGLKFNLSATQAYGYFNGGVWSFSHGAVTGSEEYSIDIAANGTVTVKINGVVKQTFAGVNSSYKLAVSAGSSSALLSNIRLTNATYPEKTLCLDRDTDNDGIPNRLDLDSDADGCSDAYEAGTTTNTTANFAHPAPHGANGFANSLEATADNGIYNGTYKSLYVIDKLTKACLDSDADNINDLVDIDDDNDGVLDAEECESPVFDNWTDLASYKSKMLSSAFHGTLLRSKSGKYYVVGQYASATGTDITIPTLVTPANGYNYTGEVIDMAAVGSNSSYALATTEGIWVWGYLNTNFVLPGTTNTAASAFQKVSLPSEIDPKNIKSISVSTNNFMILLNDGTVYAYGKSNAPLNGAGLTTATAAFTKVLIAANTPLTNIAQIEATSNGSFAADVTNNKLYTWGTNVYLGNGSAFSTKNYATEMTNPVPSGFGIAMIDATYSTSMTYLVLGSNKKVYSMGSGAAGILGQNSTTDLTSWTNVKGKDGVGVLENVEYLSAQNSTDGFPSASVILNTAQPLSWGDAGGANMLGLGNASTLVPKTPDGIAPSEIIYVLENGGHLTPMLNDKGEIGNVGHNVSGSFADGSTQNRAIYIFNAFERGTDFSDNIAPSCNPDIDGDGIPNRLDLDTDGDGCSDAKEAGVSGTLLSGNLVNTLNGSLTNTTVNNALAQGAFGANGLADGVETSANSGSINYSTTYANYAKSATVSMCADFDNDGVADIMDIDDDNDGILDAIESPNCYLPATFFASGDRRTTFTISSEIPRVSPFNQPKNLIDGDGATAAIGFVNNETIVNKELYKIMFNYPVLLSQLTLRFVDGNSHFNAGAIVKVQGSNDNATWTDLNTGTTFNTLTDNTIVAPFWTVSTSNEIFTVTQNQGRYKYYRLYGTAGTVRALGYATEFYFTSATSYESSFYPKATCTATDTDNDGIVNNFDLDSDGDGCSDAKEAGTTTSTTVNFAHPIPHGANGFADALETTAESGVYNGTYSYSFATTNTINACIDTDSDGVGDIIDLDDDNDGVLDRTECTPTPASILFAGSNEDFNTMRSSLFAEFNNNKATGATIVQSNIIETATVPAGFYDGYDMVIFGGAAFNTIHANHWAALQTAIQNKTSKAFIIQSDNCCVAANRNGLVSLLNNVFGSDYTVSTSNPTATQTYSLNTLNSYGNLFTTSSLSGANYFPILNVPSSDVLFYSPSVSGSAVAGMKQLPGTADQSRFLAWFVDGTITQGAPWYTSNENKIAKAFFDVYGSTAPMNCDTDGDGIFNHLDLDSDGDNCSDAKEAGTTTSATANYAHPAPHGTNGFTNALETTTDNGVYNGTYTYNIASNNALNGCLDTDSDGVGDLIDLDDDNDGVLDVVECPQMTPYKVYTHNRADGTFAQNVPVIISGKTTQTVALDQRTQGVAPNNFSANGLSSWKLIASDISPNSQNKISVKIAPNSSTLGSYTSADAMLITNGVNTYVIDNTSSVAGEFATSGTWLSQSTAGSYINNSNQYVQTPFTSSPTATWTFSTAVCTDSDNDGTPNYLDLDSDGDGCSDSKEAGSSTTETSTTIYPTGTDTNGNGLLNNYESSTVGSINYTSTYTNYALVSLVNACLDTDSDGVNDIIDIDDDNDGVVDSEECGCIKSGTSVPLITPSAIVTIPTNKFGGVTTSSKAFDGSGLSQTPSTVASLSTITHSSPTYISNAAYTNDGAGMSDDWKFTLSTSADIKGMAIWTPGSYAYGGGDAPFKKFNVSWIDCSGTLKSQMFDLGTPSPIAKIIYFDEPILNVSEFTFDLLEVWYDQEMDQGVSDGWEIATPATIPNSYNVTLGEIRFISQIGGFSMICSNDTDNDGIPNRLDLDSDNDGCSDAKEAG